MMKMHRILALALALIATPVLAQTNPGTSPLSVPKGGTGKATFSANCILYGAVTSPLLCAGPTANGVLTYNGSGVPTSSTTLPSSLTIPAPDINGGTADNLTSLGIRSTGSAFDTLLAVTEVLTGNRTLTFTLNDANRTINLGGNVTTAGAFATSGANALTLTTTGATDVTLPTTGTLGTLAGSETLTNKSVNLSSNTLSGTIAQFNTALSDGDFATLAGAETLTNKTLTSPAVNTPSISGGTINNNIIGGSTPAAGTFTAFTATQTAYLTGVISPTQIVANTDNYAPTGFSTATVLRLSTDASRQITGLAGGTAGRVIVIQNVGSQDIVLKNDVTSTEENRFLIGADTTVGVGTACTLRYDGTSSRWRMIGACGAGGGGGGSGTVTSVATGAGLQGGTITASGTVEWSDFYRRNILQDRIQLSKALAEYQRRINEFATGFKGASDALNGINTGSSSNYTVTPASGYVAPSVTAGTVNTGSTPNTTTAITNLTLFDLGLTVTNGDVIHSVGVYLTTAASIVAKVGLRNSSSNYDIVVSSACSHPGGGWHDCVLSSPYTVPGSGTYRIGFYHPGSPGSNSFVSTGSRGQASGDKTGNGATGFTDNGDGTVGVRYTEVGATNNMTLVTTALTADATVSNGRALISYDDTSSGLQSITLETDLNARVTCDGSNWADTVLSSAGTGQGGRKLAETADTSCGANTGTSYAVEITSSNNKMFRLHGLTLSMH